jgi:hypothetical protein
MVLLTWLWVIDGLILGADSSLFLSFLSVLYQVNSKNSAKGISLQTLFLVASARVIHLLSHSLELHFDPTMVPSFFYSLFDIVNALFAVFVLYVVLTRHLNTYEAEKDNFGEGMMVKLFGTPFGEKTFMNRMLRRGGFLYAFALTLGFVWYLVRRSNQGFFHSYFCCVYEVLGAISLLPQLWMFQKDKIASPQLANFVVLVAINRLCTLTFWTIYPWVFHWRYPDNRGVQMASEIINLLIISDFLFYYVRAKMRGQDFVRIPTSAFEDV